MEKFKLIKSYPGSPEVGTVVHPTPVDKDIFTDDAKFRIHRSILENHPEFWESPEVIHSAEFRIRTSKGTKVITSKSVKTDDNGVFLSFPGFEMYLQYSPNETEFKFCD